MDNIAIIPARGGSKRLHRKNIKPIKGLPIMSYPIKAAIDSGLFKHIIVSTDDLEIMSIAKELHVDVINRPTALSTDTASVVDVCCHVLDTYTYHNCNKFCCIYPTALFLKYEHLIDSHELMSQKPESDYVMGVSKYNFSPVQALEEKNGYLTYMWPEFKGKKSQQQPTLTVSNGSLYWARINQFINDKTFYGEKLRGYELFTVDIDTELDFKIADCLYNNQELLKI